MPLTTSAFKNRCANQNISLNPVLTSVLDDYYGLDESLFDTIEEVSRHIRKEASPLANRRLEGNIWGNDTAAVALRRIINGTIQPARVEPPELNFHCKDAKTISACSYAETTFSDTIHEIQSGLMPPKGGEGERKGNGCDVFTHNGEPIFLRKSIGEPSSLSLVDITVNGVPYPRGSIFRVQTRDDEEKDYPNPSQSGMREIDIDDITSVGFRRLSIWALSPDERSDERIEYVFGGRHEIVANRTIEEIQASIQTALTGAETTPKPQAPKAPPVRPPYNHFVILSQLALGRKV